MFCQNCGSELPDRVKFCPGCGTPVSEPIAEQRKMSTEKMTRQGAKVTKNIYFCEDGKYRWIYEMSLFRNPTVIILVWKIFFFILLGIFVFAMLLDVFSGDMDAERFLGTLKILVYFIIGMTVLCALGYLLYAAIMGGKYIVMFEMDEAGVNHKQMPVQLKKAGAIGLLTVLAGLASRNIATVGVGLNSTARSEMYSEFSKVRSVKLFPRRDLIKVNAPFCKNQVYAAKDDYDFVMNYICQRIPDSAKPKL